MVLIRPFLLGIFWLWSIVAAEPARGESAGQHLFVDPQSTTAEAVRALDGQARRDALLLAQFPSAVWFSSGTPESVEESSRALMARTARAGAVPVLVAYNIPFRDCALYSAGGAADTDAYLKWMRGLANGIGDGHAIVILEPDGLGIIPWHRKLDGALESCQPAGLDERAAEERFRQLRGAVAILSALPNIRLYLDGTGSSWLPPGEAAHRLMRADVARTAGFFLNVSNFESDDRVTAYARWVSDCLALVTDGGLDPRQCPSQYDPATFDDYSTWTTTDRAYDGLFHMAGLLRNPLGQKRAVIDSSRNGRGSWSPPAGRYRDAELWCNPPGRGLGRRPTFDTRHAFVDAFLWIKIPGESDGACLRGTTGPDDPERRTIAPPAGRWFPQQARELIEFANPPVEVD